MASGCILTGITRAAKVLPLTTLLSYMMFCGAIFLQMFNRILHVFSVRVSVLLLLLLYFETESIWAINQSWLSREFVGLWLHNYYNWHLSEEIIVKLVVPRIAHRTDLWPEQFLQHVLLFRDLWQKHFIHIAVVEVQTAIFYVHYGLRLLNARRCNVCAFGLSDRCVRSIFL